MEFRRGLFRLVAIGGYLSQPVPVAVPSVPAKVPLLGGYSLQHQEQTSFSFVRFCSVLASAIGIVNAEAIAETHSRGIVEDLTIGDRVSVRLCGAEVASVQLPGKQSAVRIERVELQGLTLDGYGIDVDFRFPFNDLPTLDSLRHVYANDRSFKSEWEPI